MYVDILSAHIHGFLWDPGLQLPIVVSHYVVLELNIEFRSSEIVTVLNYWATSPDTAFSLMRSLLRFSSF